MMFQPVTLIMAVLVAAISTIFVPGTAVAAYPERAVKLIVTFPAGGRSDLTGRSITEGLERAISALRLP